MLPAIPLFLALSIAFSAIIRYSTWQGPHHTYCVSLLRSSVRSYFLCAECAFHLVSPTTLEVLVAPIVEKLKSFPQTEWRRSHQCHCAYRRTGNGIKRDGRGGCRGEI